MTDVKAATMKRSRLHLSTETLLNLRGSPLLICQSAQLIESSRHSEDGFTNSNASELRRPTACDQLQKARTEATAGGLPLEWCRRAEVNYSAHARARLRSGLRPVRLRCYL